eukprot:TRINITY_DN17207_c0_g1_i14.p1 TRINITY_DN17207_c0_g1~~TRINITY_DN17207_c0_g1_i14.p1  ORF type:complete len:258 (-),score=63.94 TRINITY_DN17207_c0_g1_i14:327-1100(-)
MSAPKSPPSPSQMNSFFQETKEKLESRDPQTVAILVALIVGLVTLALILFISKRRKFGRGILLCGVCDSGKTTLFSQLIQGKPIETYTSLQENTGILSLAGMKPVNLVDIPGHERLRDNILAKYVGSARGIVYVVDSSVVSKQIRDITEFLFNILSNPVVYSARPSVLIACNKQDLGLVKGASVIQTLLEKEINALRVSHSNTLQGTDGEGPDHVFLGVPGKQFAFSDLACKVTFAEVNTQSNEATEPVTEWIRSVA